MHHEELKSKANKLLMDTECIRMVLEGFKGNYKTRIKPDLRNSLVREIEMIQEKIMKEVWEEQRSIDPFVDLEEEEVWICVRLPSGSTHATFFATKVAREGAEEFVKKVSDESTRYLRPEIIRDRLPELKRRILQGEFDDKLFDDASILVFDLM